MWHGHTPFSDVIRRLESSIINLHTKFDVYVHLLRRYKRQCRMYKFSDLGDKGTPKVNCNIIEM